jgi:chitodextrinase
MEFIIIIITTIITMICYLCASSSATRPIADTAQCKYLKTRDKWDASTVENKHINVEKVNSQTQR